MCRNNSADNLDILLFTMECLENSILSKLINFININDYPKHYIDNLIEFKMNSSLKTTKPSKFSRIDKLNEIFNIYEIINLYITQNHIKYIIFKLLYINEKKYLNEKITKKQEDLINAYFNKYKFYFRLLYPITVIGKDNFFNDECINQIAINSLLCLYINCYTDGLTEIWKFVNNNHLLQGSIISL
jgi:hypothetical protein